ncbi:unnamed protein product [Macrosiphum euphorbiae]|uniref:Uncharacterized protein n=1 Tax=Macrosiphum euphorbiae TaxID=13131 RepID=A0AAV0XKI6_9HEMI|nr:unnamed protein product [Macrosiphum euphorbiae]
MSDENAQSDQLHTDEPQITPENQDTSTPTSKKRKIINEDNSKLDKAFKILESAASASAEKTESQSFGQFVGKKLETYNQQVRSIVQYEMSNILFKADSGYFNQQLTSTYQNNHYRYNSDPSNYNYNYNYNPHNYPTNIHTSLPHTLPARETNITSLPVPQTSPATITQTSTPHPSPANTYYNYNPHNYPTNIHTSLPHTLPARETNITSLPVPQTSPATITQTSTPHTSPANTYTSEELDFSDIIV